MAERPPRLAPVGKDMVAERLAWLHEKFPEAVRDGVLDPATLLASLGVDVAAEGTERFGLAWPGKAACFRTLQARSVGTLLPMREDSVDFDRTGNVIVEGDNLEVLKLVQNAYVGQVKMIYIDPPYNTGGDFVYPDNYEDGLDEYLRMTGQKDGEGRPMSALRETDGRFHSKWLSMMYPRLFLAKSLLRPDGVIFVSIDDHEVHRLRMVLDEVFGEENFIGEILWKKRSTPPNDKVIGANHDYIIAYARDITEVTLNLRARSDEQIERYQNPDDHPKGPWMPGDLMGNVKGGRYVASLHFPIVNPNTGEKHFPSSNGNWRFNEDRINELIAADEIYFGQDGKGRPKLKRFLCDVKEGMTYPTIWDFVPLNTSGSSEMADLLGNMNIFENPKPSGLIKELLRLGSNKDSLVVDFFGGSGTTAHAVLELNKEDGGHRKFILVQLPEPIEGGEYPTIAHLTRERVRRVIDRLNAEDGEAKAAGEDSLFASSGDTDNAAPPDRGFRAFRLASSNFTVWDGRDPKLRDADALAGAVGLFAEHRVVAGRTSEDLFFEVLLRLGLPLTAPYEIVTLADTPVYSLEDGLILVCLADRIPLECVEAMAERHPMQIVCAEAGLGGDVALVNAHETVKSIAREEDEDNDIGFQLV